MTTIQKWNPVIRHGEAQLNNDIPDPIQDSAYSFVATSRQARHSVDQALMIRSKNDFNQKMSPRAYQTGASLTRNPNKESEDFYARRLMDGDTFTEIQEHSRLEDNRGFG